MKKLILAGITMLLCTSTAWGAACSTGSLASYITLGTGGCTVADKTFSGFSYNETLTGGAAAIGTSGIQVTPLSNDPNNPGLEFSSTGWSVSAGKAIDSLINFLVTITGGPQLIKDASVLQLGSGFLNDGQVTVTESLCNGANCVNGSSLFTKNSSTLVHLQDNVLFAFGPVTTLSAAKDILLNGGATGASAVSAVDDRFSQTPVPEPASILLLGTCLLGAGRLIQKRLTNV